MIDSWNMSREYLQRAQKSLTGGVNSPFRAKAPVPLYFTTGCGARLRDVDGNEYIDYVLAWGPMILGYRHPAIVEAMRRQADLPIDYGAQHVTEFLAAELFQKMVPCAQRLTFCSSGSEAVQLVHRLARAFTGRNLILKFEGHYHGWIDSALVSYHPSAAQIGSLDQPTAVLGSRGQVPNTAENVVVAPWNRIDILNRILQEKGNQIAAVMMEPVMCNSGCILPAPEFLQQVRDLTRVHDCLLILDEVITGFRMHTGGAQAQYGVPPDIATFGKALGGGATVSAVAGCEEIMSQVIDKGVVFGGSFNGNPIAMACVHATLTELAADGGAALKHANRMGQALMDGISELIAKHKINAMLSGFGAAFAIHFTSRRELKHYRDVLDDDTAMLNRFLYRALQENVHIVPDGRFYTSVAHIQRDIDDTLENLDRVFADLR